MPKLALDFNEDGGCIKELMLQAKKLGYMVYEDLIKCIHSKGISDQDQIDEIIAMIGDMGITISEKLE